MYINAITLKNIRGYKETNITFSKNINLLLGANNAGKSTILKAIYKLQKNYILNKDDVRKTYQKGEVFIDLSEIEEQNKVLFKKGHPHNSRFPYSSDQTIFFGIPIDNSEEKFFYDSCNKIQRTKNGGIILSNKKRKGDELFYFAGFPEKENENNFIYPFFAKRKLHGYSHRAGKDSAYSIYDDFTNLASKIAKVGNSSHYRNKEFVHYCNEILGFGIGLVPGSNDHEDKIGIYIKDSYAIPIECMGEGVINILGLIVILLTEDNKLFLIEEIENDIHPEALKKLLNLIIEKSNKNQFIISTHSNIVLKYLASVSNSKLFHISWKSTEETLNGLLNIPTSKIDEVKNTPEERLKLLEKLGYDLFDFEMYKSYLILEESSAEQIIRDFIIPEFVPALYNKIKTIAAKGADDLPAKFNDFHRLFVYVHTNPIYNKKAWVIADGDEAGQRNISLLRDKFKTWPNSHFINLKETNIEFYYPDRFQDKVKKIMEIKDDRKKHKEKGLLTKEVMEWILTNRNEAKNEFKKSAKELIKIIQDISKKVNRNNQT